MRTYPNKPIHAKFTTTAIVKPANGLLIAPSKGNLDFFGDPEAIEHAPSDNSIAIWD